jgi:hypothetical protein
VKGNLVVTVHEAEDMKDTELIGKQDPFVRIRFPHNKAGN